MPWKRLIWRCRLYHFDVYQLFGNRYLVCLRLRFSISQLSHALWMLDAELDRKAYGLLDLYMIMIMIMDAGVMKNLRGSSELEGYGRLLSKNQAGY